MEKLGFFYLGKEYDFAKDTLKKTFLLDSSKLTTHAAILGMTGSGKTGLAITILEEAAINCIPSIIIDPKGDLGNLLLTFPDMSAQDFLPWIEESIASKNQLAREDYAIQESQKWLNGLKKWDEDKTRIERLKKSVEAVIYTPANQAGIPLSIMNSFDAPPEEIILDTHLFRDMILSTVTSLLSLMGMQVNPLNSREHILLSTIFELKWREKRSLDLPTLIQFVQKPPFDKIGVFGLETFFPAKDRSVLAMSLNNLLASPSFKSWREGEPLDIHKLLYSSLGQPKQAILSIAHLQDAERMFFLTILLNKMIGWMRAQPGTSSLRALLYMDEMYGYLPPVAMPPTKGPMLTLLKQARAFGLGIILATQNPGDIDYKALANCGLWFIGKLQTDRDRSKVLQGLKLSKDGMTKITEEKLSQLRNRIFMLLSIYEEEPIFFETRWTLSYLKGPLTLPQIKILMESKNKVFSQKAVPKVDAMPLIPLEIEEYYLKKDLATNTVWLPMAIVKGNIHFQNSKYNVDEWGKTLFALPFSEDGIHLDQSEDMNEERSYLVKGRPENGHFGTIPNTLTIAKNWEKWNKEVTLSLCQELAVEIYNVPELDLYSHKNESEQDFRARVSHVAREVKEKKIQALKAVYESKIQAAKEKMRKCEMKLSQKQADAGSQIFSTIISFVETIFKVIVGKWSSTTISKAGTSVRNAQKIGKKQQDIKNAEEEMSECQQKLDELESSLKQEIENIERQEFPIEVIKIRAKKSDSSFSPLALLWIPKTL